MAGKIDTARMQKIFAVHLGVTGLHIALRRIWSSRVPNFRIKIRREIQRRLVAAPSVLNLDVIPELNQAAVSISHCRGFGGFCALANASDLGFDVELKSRVSEKRLQQVTHPLELEECPNPAMLWSAKEAGFKCLLKAGQPRGVKDIRISGWKPLRHKLHMDLRVMRCSVEWDARPELKLRTVVIDDGAAVYAVCVRETETEVSHGAMAIH